MAALTTTTSPTASAATRVGHDGLAAKPSAEVASVVCTISPSSQAPDMADAAVLFFAGEQGTRPTDSSDKR